MSKIHRSPPQNQASQAKSRTYNGKPIDGVNIVTSGPKISQTQAQQLAEQIRASYQADAFETGRPQDANASIHVALLPNGFYQQVTGDNPSAMPVANANGQPKPSSPTANYLLLSKDYLKQPASSNASLVAQNLGAIEDENLAPRARTRVPVYLQQAKAILMGDSTVASQGINNPAVAQARAALSNPKSKDYTSAKAAKMFRGANSTPAENHLAALYMEWLRVHVLQKPGAQNRNAALQAYGGILTQLNANPKETFATAFASQFGMSPTQAQQGFMQFLDTTQGQPAQRLMGTIYG